LLLPEEDADEETASLAGDDVDNNLEEELESSDGGNKGQELDREEKGRELGNGETKVGEPASPANGLHV
jgi:hypothetical protein